MIQTQTIMTVLSKRLEYSLVEKVLKFLLSSHSSTFQVIAGEAGGDAETPKGEVLGLSSPCFAGRTWLLS